MMDYYNFEALRGYAAHAQILTGLDCEYIKATIEIDGRFRIQHQIRIVQTGAVLFAGLGHGLAHAYHEWLGENLPYWDERNSGMTVKVADLVGETISQAQYEQMKMF